MAYVERYFHQFCDQYGDTHRISILQDGFGGSATEIEGQPNPILITYESSSEFKFDPIRPSTAEVYLTFGTGNDVDFEEFWTADEREFKVEYYRDSVLEWLGYVIPNGFSYELRGGVYYAEIKASCGLSTLESIPFSLNGVPYGIQTDLTYNNDFEFPFILIVTEILRKLDLDINTWSCVDVYERNMTKTGDTRDADPLANAYVNVKTYINDSERKDIPYWKDIGEVFNCKEVLENLCYIFGAIIYQSKGVWRIKRRNVDADYGSGATQRYWRKYNTAAVYLGFETVNNEINIECSTIANAMIGNDHLMSMDEVYKKFRINYEYTFVREGDEPVALIKNPNFINFLASSRLAAPERWVRWRQGNKWYPKLQPITISETSETDGITTGIQMGTQSDTVDSGTLDPNAAIWASLRYNEQIEVVKGETLSFEAYAKYNFVLTGRSINYYPVFKMKLVSSVDQKIYYLKNNPSVVNGRTITTYDWSEEECFFYLLASAAENYDFAEVYDYRWYKFASEIASIPDTGKITFDIHGLTATEGRDSSNFPAFPVYFLDRGSVRLYKALKTVRLDWVDWGGDIPRLRLTNVKLGRFPNESELPQSQDFIYENQTGEYSLQVDPLTVLNGDEQDAAHISNIIVPENDTGGKNFWDTIDDKYGRSSIGLITTKSIMNQYISPFRILEGTIMAQGLDFDKRITFTAVPSVQFIIQSGTFNPLRSYLQDAVFKQISNVAIAPGGSESGNTLDPEWIRTGNIRCEKSGLGLNTGYREWQEVDSNPASETYGQTQWISSAPIQDIFGCPQGEPSPYYWGTDVDPLDPDNLTDFTYTLDSAFPREVQVSYDNPGGEYIYFVHLDSLGLVEEVTTSEQENIISDFQYLADIMIDGFLYKVLRQNYVTADFEDLVIIYTFNQNQTEPAGEPEPGLVTYYRVLLCGSNSSISPTAYTTLEPPIANQRYIDYSNLNYYRWDGTDTELSSPPATFIGTFQLISGQSGCP